MAVVRKMFKGGSIRVTGEVRGCEPEVMAVFDWPYPWPLEVIGYAARGAKQVIAVCRDHETANDVLRDWSRSMGGVQIVDADVAATKTTRMR